MLIHTLSQIIGIACMSHGYPGPGLYSSSISRRITLGLLTLAQGLCTVGEAEASLIIRLQHQTVKRRRYFKSEKRIVAAAFTFNLLISNNIIKPY